MHYHSKDGKADQTGNPTPVPLAYIVIHAICVKIGYGFLIFLPFSQVLST